MASVSKRVVKSLAEKMAMLPAGAKPTKKVEPDGRVKWLRPLFSLRQLAEMKKAADSENISWPIEKKPSLYSTEKTFYERRILNCKGHKYERDKPAREADIAKRMAEMPKAIEKWREEQRKSRTKTELQKLLNVPVKFVK